MWKDGLFMAWRKCFILPCPVRCDNAQAKNQMYFFLPVIGLLIGILWAVAGWLTLNVPMALRAFVMAVLPWVCARMAHVKGFVSICGKGRTTAQKQNGILYFILLALGQWSLFLSTSDAVIPVLIAIPVAVRCVIALLFCGTWGRKKEKTDLIFVIPPLALLLAAVVLSPVLCGWVGLAPLGGAAVCFLSAVLLSFGSDGLSDGVADLAVVLGEFAAVCILCLV